MDKLLANHNQPEILVGVEVSEEGSGPVVGIKDMVMTSLSNMSMTSGVVKVVVTSEDVYYEYSKKQQFRAPDYFIRLSSPQIERHQRSNTAGLDINVPVLPGSLEASRKAVSSLISLDMNMGSHHTLQLIPGANARNSIALVNSTAKVDLSLGNPQSTDEYGIDDDYSEPMIEDTEFKLDDDGEPLEDSYHRNSDFQPSVGKFTKFGTHFQLNYRYREGQHAAIRTLIELGAIEVIGKYAKLPYRDCLSDPNSIPVQAAHGFTPHPVMSITPASPRTSDYKPGDLVEVKVTVSERAFVYCYYQDQDNSIYQILPNPYQPDNKINPGQARLLPGDKRLKLEADAGSGIEQIQCAAHSLSVEDKLPAELTELDFDPVPYKSINELISLHRIVNPKYTLSNVYKINGH